MNTRSPNSRPRSLIAALAGLSLLGLGLRLFRLANVPLGGHGDVAWNGLEALDWLSGRTWPFYVYHIYAPEPLIIYLTGLSVAVLGPTFLAARLVTTLASALVVPVGFAAACLLGRLNGDPAARADRRTAWLFALAYAVSFYPIILSKTGQRAQVFPLLVIGLAALLARAWRSGRPPAFAAAAVVLALANYLYIPARLLPLLAAIWIAYEVLAARREASAGGVRRRLALAGGMLALAALLIAPQIVLYLRTPEAFTARADQAAGQLIFRTLAGADLARALLGKIAGELAIFILPWRGAYAEMGHPLLELPLALGAILGAVLALRRRADRLLWWPLLGLPVMMLTDIVSGTQPEPHGLRMIGVLPLAFLLAARGLALAWGWLEARLPAALPVALPGLLAALILIPGLAGLARYHFVFIPALRADPATVNRLEAADVFLADLILAHAGDGVPILLSLDDFTRPNVTYLLSAAYPTRRGLALRPDGSPDLPALDGPVWVAVPADPYRPRHDGIAPEQDGRGWVLLADGAMTILPPLRAGAALAADDLPEAARLDDWTGRPAASLRAASLPPDAFDAALTPADVNLGGEVALIGYAVDSATLTPGQPLWITLYWRALRPPAQDYETFVQVLDAGGQPVAQVHRWTFDGQYRTRLWRPDEVVPARFRLALPADLPPGPYTVIAGLYRVLENSPLPVLDAAGNPAAPHAALTGFRVALPPAAVTRPAPPASLTFGGTIALAGLSVERQGSDLVLGLDWQALARPAGDHTLFVHVVGEDGAIVAQADVRPRGGSYPTGIWQPGEVVPDEVRVPLPAGLPAGRYTVYSGWYTLPDAARLPALVDGQPAPADRVLLAVVELP